MMVMHYYYGYNQFLMKFWFLGVRGGLAVSSSMQVISVHLSTMLLFMPELEALSVFWPSLTTDLDYCLVVLFYLAEGLLMTILYFFESYSYSIVLSYNSSCSYYIISENCQYFYLFSCMNSKLCEMDYFLDTLRRLMCRFIVALFILFRTYIFTLIYANF